MEHFNRASSTSKVQRISSSNNAADFNHATSLYSGRAEQSLPWLNPTGLCSVALLGHFAWSSFHVQALCRHLSRKWLLPSSRTLPHLLRMTGSVLLGGRCLASPTTTSTSSRPFRRCLAVCSLEDTASASASSPHPHHLSRLWWMPGSVLTGGRCLMHLITAHTLPISRRRLTVTSLEDAVSIFTLLTHSPLVRQRPSLWDERCSGSSCSPSARQWPSSWDVPCSGSLAFWKVSPLAR